MVDVTYRATVFHCEKEVEKLNQDLHNRPKKEEVCAMEEEMKNLQEKLTGTERQLSETFKDVARASAALVRLTHGEDMNNICKMFTINN